MAAKEPEKKIPSTAAKATRRCAKVERLSAIHLRAQSAFLRMQGTSRKALELTRQRFDIGCDLTRVYSIEQVCSLLLLLDVRINKQ